MRWIISAIIAISCLVGAPLAGTYISGGAVKDYLVFPPVAASPPTDHAPFSHFAFFFFLFIIIMVTGPFLIKIFSSKGPGLKSGTSGYRFPAWGWTGLLIMAAGWILAWTRFPLFAPLQIHTFSVPWAGYIMVVNALTFKRSGRSLITHEPLYLTLLFIFSALFWWYFEYLNQFVQNWYYVNVDSLGRLEFFIHATLPFSTVLPAVISTMHLLRTYQRLSRGLGSFIGISASRPRVSAIFAALAGAGALSATAIFPDYLFPMLWIAPLVIMASAMLIAGIPAFLRDIPRGDWRTVWLLALSALVCGFFWEMWNYFSYARWEYAVPFVNGFKIFEMPLPGYAGYLFFGLQCGLMAYLVENILNFFRRANTQGGFKTDKLS